MAEKATAVFPSLAHALALPWRKLRARYTHKLVYVLRGGAACLTFERPLQGPKLDLFGA